MRWILYLGLLAAALMVPLDKNNVGDLQPMEAIYLTRKDDLVVIKTDTEDLGIGDSLDEAVRNMHETTPGIVYLDTADFLILDPNAKELLWEMRGYVRPTVRVCLAEDEINIADAAAYLAIHRPKVEFEEANGNNLPHLIIEDGRIQLKENSTGS